MTLKRGAMPVITKFIVVIRVGFRSIEVHVFHIAGFEFRAVYQIYLVFIFSAAYSKADQNLKSTLPVIARIYPVVDDGHWWTE